MERKRIGTGIPTTDLVLQLLVAPAMTFVFALAVATRTVLAFSPLDRIFQDDNQLSSPLTSYSRCKYLLHR